MKSGHKTILIILFVIIAAFAIYLFRDKIGVALASVYGAGMIVIRKFQSFFSNNDEEIEDIENRLKELHEVESKLIDRLQDERRELKTEINELNNKINNLETGITSKEEELKDYSNISDWEENVWKKLSKSEQKKLSKEVVGDEFDLSEFRYSDM